MSSADVFSINEISVKDFIDDAKVRGSSPGWFWRDDSGVQHLVYLDPGCPSEPYVLINGDVVDVPLDTTLTDW